MKITIFLIALFVANELSNRGFHLFAAVLVFTAFGEVFLFKWLDKVGNKINNVHNAFWDHFAQATGLYKKVLTVVIGTIGLSASIAVGAAILYLAFLLGIVPAD